MKIMCDFSVSHYFHILFILFSYVYHIFGLETQIRSPKVIFLSYSCSYLFHIIFIFLDMPGLDPLSIPQSLKLYQWQKPSTPRGTCGEHASDQNAFSPATQCIIFILFSYYLPGPPPLWGLGPGSEPKNVKLIWK